MKRLRSGEDFKKVYATRRSMKFAPVSIAYARNGLAFSRVGLSVSRKNGNAVIRNKIKRLFREAARATKLPDGYDFVLIPIVGSIISLENVKESLGLFVSKLEKK